MNSKIIAHGILRAFAILLGIGIILFFLYKIQSVIVYIAIAAVISLVGRPIVLFLRHKLKFNNTVAVIVTMVFFLSLLLGLFRMFIPLVVEQGENLSLLDIDELQNNAENLYSEIITYFDLSKIEVEQSVKESGMLSKLDYSIIPNFLNTFIGGLGESIIGLFSVLFISFFFFSNIS